MGNFNIATVDPALQSMRDAPAVRQKLHDSNILIEEYLYYAGIQREQERQGIEPDQRAQIARSESHRITTPELVTKGGLESINDKGTEAAATTTIDSLISDEDWDNATRAFRNASWISIFYLLTTDVIGPMNAPWAFSQLGYGPGVLLYLVLGLACLFGGWQVWKSFLKLDSDKYPMRTYGDLAFRIYGVWPRHVVNVLQSVQLLFNVSVIILSNGLALSQMTKFRLCFSVCCLIFPLVGMIGGQIRTLSKLGQFGHLNIWINIFVMIAVMVVAGRSDPNYEAALGTFGIPKGPIVHSSWTPKGTQFINQLNAVMQMVYAYGGTMLYVEFMAEMKRPLDFMKAVYIMEAFVIVSYMTFGLVVYSEQGQFVYNPANQGLSTYNWQTVTNVLNMVGGVIFSVMCGNIALKVIYNNLILDFGGPQLNSKRGKLIWFCMVPVYWAIAFIVASAVPQISYIAGMVAAVCILQFSYTFPPLLFFGLKLQEDAIHLSETFDPATNSVRRIDTWRDLSRWKRGLKRQWWLKLICVVFFIASASTAVMGMYASILSLIAAFDLGHATSFGCHSPAQG